MKTWKSTYRIFILVVILGLYTLYAFDQKGVERDSTENASTLVIPPLVQIELDKKIARYQRTILKKCKDRAYEAAEAYVDSLVAEELRLQASDTLKFPPKPIRPELREPIILNDSTPIAPILESKDSI